MLRRLIGVTISMLALGCGSNDNTTDAPDADAARDAFESIPIGPDVVGDDGPVRGVVDGELIVFKGIPFAAAPIGALRFAPPTRPAPWTSVRDTNAFGPACPQTIAADAAPLPRDEDCLSVNVWTHRIGAPRPVLMWIHGGGYVEGSARFATYDGAELARRTGLTVVSINYRVGLLGFLALPQLTAADGGTGNWGLRDQIAALDWVQRNIQRFGGDRAHVMIAGESAGGASICTLLASPLSQGKFQAAAMQSGNCSLVLEKNAPTGNFPSAFGAGQSTAIALNCIAGDIATCLRNKPVADMLTVQGQLVGSSDVGVPVGPTLPIVDGVVLDQRPLAALRAGRGNVPIIAGVNRDDTSAFVFQAIPEQPGAFAAYLDSIGRSAEKTALLTMYPPATLTELGAGIAYTTDVAFACPALALANMHPSTSYLYELVRPASNGPLAFLGAFHGLDFLHLFGTYAEFGIAPDAGDALLRATMEKAWADVAAGRVPTVQPPWLPAPSHLALDATSANSPTWRNGHCAQLQDLGVLRP